MIQTQDPCPTAGPLLRHTLSNRKIPLEGPVILLSEGPGKWKVSLPPGGLAACLGISLALSEPPSLDLNNQPSGSKRPHFPDRLMSSVPTQQLLKDHGMGGGGWGEEATGEFCSSFSLI